MASPPPPAPLEVSRDGLVLRGEAAGEGTPVLLLHGLTATRRYVLHGSRSLERRARVIAYDARGHGSSDPAPDPTAYGYDHLAADAAAMLDAATQGPAVLVGSSMGAATAVRLALDDPERVAGLVLITPAHRGVPATEAGLRRWDALAAGLERDGVEGFLAAYGTPRVPERWLGSVEATLRQRLERHRHPEAVAAALRVVPRSAAFRGMAALETLRAPALVIGSRDEADPGHPLAVARAYAERIPGARLLVEEAGEPPLAWRGGRLAEAVGDWLDRVHGADQKVGRPPAGCEPSPFGVRNNADMSNIGMVAAPE